MMRKNLDKSNIVFSYPEYINPSKAGLFESIFSGGSGGGGGGGGVSVCVCWRGGQYDQPLFL